VTGSTNSGALLDGELVVVGHKALDEAVFT